MRILVPLLLIAACSGDKESSDPTSTADVDTDADTDADADADADSDADADTDADTDTDTDADSDTAPTADTATVAPGSLFFDATGTIDGVPTTFTCREGDAQYAFYATQSTDGKGTYSLGGACSLSDSQQSLSVNIGVVTTGVTSSLACTPSYGIQVLDLFGGTSYNCLLHGANPFAVTVDEFTVEPDGSVVWGGTFEVRGSGSMAVELVGAYRFRSVP